MKTYYKDFTNPEASINAYESYAFAQRRINLGHNVRRGWTEGEPPRLRVVFSAGPLDLANAIEAREDRSDKPEKRR